MAELPDTIESLSQQIAKLHMQGELILDQPVGKHIRRVTIAQMMSAPTPGPDGRLLLGGRECKYIEVVANVACVTKVGSRIDFTLDDGFGRMDAWIPLEHSDNPSQQKTISSLMPFDYAHIEGKVQRPAGSTETNFEIISIRRLQTGYEALLHLLQVLAEIDETIKDSESHLEEVPKVLTPANEHKPRLVNSPSVKRRQSKGKAKETPHPQSPLQEPSISAAKARRHRLSSISTYSPKALGNNILRYFRKNVSAATSPKGISVHDKVLQHLMHEQNMQDLTSREFQDAIEYLIEEGYIYSTIDEFHYGLST